MSDISALITRAQRAPSCFCCVRTQSKDTTYEPGSRPSPDTDSASALILDFSGSITLRNECLLFIGSQPGWDVLGASHTWLAVGAGCQLGAQPG